MWYYMKACDAIVSICTRYGKVHNIVYCYAYFCLLWHYKRQKMIWWIFRRLLGGFLEALRRKMQEKIIIIIWYTFESST